VGVPYVLGLADQEEDTVKDEMATEMVEGAARKGL
jgi:hypothetical protein